MILLDGPEKTEALRKDLNRDDFLRILTEPRHALTMEQSSVAVAVASSARAARSKRSSAIRELAAHVIHASPWID